MTKFFEKPSVFSTLQIDTKDESSLKYKAINLLQELTAGHLEDKDPTALIDIDIKRLNFVKNNSTSTHKDSLYKEILKKQLNTYSKNPAGTEYAHALAQALVAEGHKYKPLVSEEHKWAMKEAYEVCEKAIDSHSASRGANNAQVLLENIKAKHLNLTLEQVNVPNRPFRALLQYRNVEEVFAKTIKLSEEDREAIAALQADHRSREDDKVLKFLLNRAAVNSWNVSLPNDGDYQEHSAEIKIPSLEPGTYAVLVASSEAFSPSNDIITFAQVQVSQLGFFSRSKEEAKEFFVTDRETSKPLVGATAIFWQSEYDYKTRKNRRKKYAEKVTDKNGYVSINPGKRGRNLSVQFIKGNDELRSANFYHYFNEQEERTIRKTVFFTDRAIYRPGQAIHFKGILFEQKGDEITPFESKYTDVIFYDVNGEKVADMELMSNEFGTVKGTFTAPVGPIERSNAHR